MLSRIHYVRLSFRHVTRPSLRAVGACNAPHSSFTLSTKIGANRPSDDPVEPSGASFPSTPASEPLKHAAPVNVAEEEETHGEYTSLTTKLDHHPISSPNESRPHPQHAPLSSLLPPSTSSNLNSQHRFLANSRRAGLNPASTVFTGTRYEYLTLSSLRRLAIELVRIGGSGDKGVDLVGFWHLPQWQGKAATAVLGARDDRAADGGKIGEKIRVVVQCKRISPTARSSKTIGPDRVRELEGAFRGAPAGWRASNEVLGLLVSTRAATKGVIEGLKRSERALGWVLLEEIEESDEISRGESSEVEGSVSSGKEDDEDENDDVPSLPGYKMVRGRIRQILWNQKAKELGLEGLDVVKRYHTNADKSRADEVVLMWKGKPVECLSPEEHP